MKKEIRKVSSLRKNSLRDSRVFENIVISKVAISLAFWHLMKSTFKFPRLLLLSILARKTEAPKTKSGIERLLIYRSKYIVIIMHLMLKWDSPSNVRKNVWNIATLNEVVWVTKKCFGKTKFTRIKRKQIGQNLQVSATLVKSKKPLGCLISKLFASLLTYILIYRSKDAQIHFWFWISLVSVPVYF